MSTIDILAQFVCQTTFGDLPKHVIQCAKYRIFDTIGVLLSGYRYQFHKPVWDTVRPYAKVREATVAGEGIKVPCSMAALVNSMLCDGMSDGSRFAGVHPSPIVIPAVLAVLETESSKRSLDGRDLILATTLGYEVMIRLGQTIMPSAVLRGFHPTSIIGPMAAAAATAKLLGLDTSQTINALSIAALLGSGLVEAFNAPRIYVQIQEARATESGVFAALLSKQGAPGRTDIMDAAFARAYSDEYHPQTVSHGLGKEYMITKTYIIMHYGCRHLHAPIDAATTIVKRNALAVDDIEHIVVRTYKVAAELGIEVPKNQDEAGSSIPFGIAVALIYGDAFQERFAPDYFKDSKVISLIKRIEVKHDPNLDREYPEKRGTELEVVTRDGRLFKAKLDLARGEPELPFTRQELDAKFHRLTQNVLSDQSRRTVIDLIDKLEYENDLSKLFRCLKAKPQNG